MSHFYLLALAENPDRLPELLDRYDENREVEEYEAQCYCVGFQARLEAQERFAQENPDFRERVEAARNGFRDLDQRLDAALGGEWKAAALFVKVGETVAALERMGAPADRLEPFREEERQQAEAWFALHRWRDETVASYEREHPAFAAADPTCENCGGRGVYMTKANPEGKWDWYQLGGRWTGEYEPDYDPAEDPRHYEQCFVCGGSGKRYWRAEATASPPEGLDALVSHEEDGMYVRRGPSTPDDPLAEEMACNGCDGTGVARKWPTQWEADRGVVERPSVVGNLIRAGKSGVPYAVLLPDGEWVAQGQMGWFGMSADEMDDATWQERVLQLLDMAAVGGDAAARIDALRARFAEAEEPDWEAFERQVAPMVALLERGGVWPEGLFAFVIDCHT